MSRLPPDVRVLGRWLLSPETAEVILGDLAEEASQRSGQAGGLGRGLWLRYELLRSVAAIWTEALRAPFRGAGATGGVAATVQDFRHGIRSLLRSPAFTLFATATLALGVGSATAVYSAMERVVFNPLPYPDADRMALLWRTTDGQVVFTPETKHLPVWSRLEIFEGMEAYRAGAATLTGRGAPTVLRVKSVTPGYFRFLGVEAQLGRTFLSGEHRGDGARSLVLSHELWSDRFGRSPDVLGATLTLDDEPWTVVGVLPPGVYPPNSGPGLTDVWTPLGSATEGRVWPVTRLGPGVTLEEANERLGALAEGALEAGLGPPVEWRGKAFDAASFGRGNVADRLRILFLGVVLLLLVAVVNVSNLFLRRSTERGSERAVRTALGAGRGRLLRRIVLESLAVSALGGIAGVAVARGLLDLVEASRPEATAWLLDGIRIDPRVLLFALAASVGAGLLASLLPALDLLRRRSSIAAELRGAGRGEGTVRGVRARWGLIAVEVGLSFALVTGALGIARALVELQTRDPGFETGGLVSVRVALPEWRYEEEADRRTLFRELAAELGRDPGVGALGIVEAVPPGLPGVLARPHPEGREPPQQTTWVRSAESPPGIAALLDQPLLAGRDLRPGDGEDGARPVLVGRSMARRLFPELSPSETVGRRFHLVEDGDPHTVVGVVGDVRIEGLGRDATVPFLYRARSSWGRSQTLAVRLGNGVEPDRWVAEADVRSRLLSLAPDAVIEVEPAGAAMARTLVQERFTVLVLGGFAVLALLLAGAGMYGVLSQAVAARTREIGIRISLGADGRAIGRTILGGGVAATAAGIAAGGLLAWTTLDRVAGAAFGPDVLDGSAFLLSGAVLAAVALAAIWIPARRATRLDPTTAIRME